MRYILMLATAMFSVAVEAADYLIYTYNVDGKQALYRQNLDTNRTDRLTDPSYNVWTASFAPDGSWLTFSSDETGTDQIYRMNVDGSRKQRLSFDKEQNYHPFVSPLGDKIAYSRESAGEIVLMDADGNDARVIAAHEKSNVHPMFSPDGNTLLFYSERITNEAGNPGIFLYDLATEGVSHTGFYGYHPRFSPSGGKIAFAAAPEMKGKWQIFVANIEDSESAIQITATSVNQNHPAFSPDGEYVYFVSWRDQYHEVASGKMKRPNEVYRADIDGRNPVRITTQNAVAWHPEVFSVED